MSKQKQPTYNSVQKVRKPKSIYDPDVDYAKVMQLPPAERARLFPNDFAPDGMPYGDF